MELRVNNFGEFQVKHIIRPGWRYPHGPTVAPPDDGVNFSIATGCAAPAEPLLFERADAPEQCEVARLDPETRILAFTLSATGDNEEDIHIILNMFDDAAEMPLPQLPGFTRYRVMDALPPSPEDIIKRENQIKINVPAYTSAPHNVVVFEKIIHSGGNTPCLCLEK